jgi:four helix bundle protein
MTQLPNNTITQTKSFDDKELLSRTFKFSEQIINLSQTLPRNEVNSPLIKQVIRSGTSVGSNYREACEAESGKDFVHKIRISKKEARETRYWLRLLSISNPTFEERIVPLGKESAELLKIFASISSKFNRKKSKPKAD